MRRQGETYKRTFESGIDGSVQYYAVNPARTPGAGKALVLSLHGAGVEAIGQADAYAPKDWASIVCPTNRRPFGFDWEEVGRLDAMEVLSIAQAELKTDPGRVYLTGHSMGGHGTWNLGAHFPDRFAALAPSAGWISFWTYAGGYSYNEQDPIESILKRASADSDTLALKRNFTQQGIYILHGDADDNVPVSEARRMRQELAPFQRDLQWYEQPGAGHWWDVNPEPGADCVDWPGIFDLFARRRLPAASEVRQVDFTTVNPAVSADDQWVRVTVQEKALLPSRVQLRADPISRAIVGSTENVAALSIRTTQAGLSGGPVRLELDGQKLEALGGEVALSRSGGKWSVVERAQQVLGHGFKTVFDRRFALVYCAHGTPVENQWAREKARYDAETFWYRGNGSPDVLSDEELPAHPNRNYVKYGALHPSETSGLPSAALSAGPEVGILRLDRKGSDLVGIVSGSKLVGMRLTERIPFFTSGAGIPDLLVFTPEMLDKGSAGIVGAGFSGDGLAADEYFWRP